MLTRPQTTPATGIPSAACDRNLSLLAPDSVPLFLTGRRVQREGLAARDLLARNATLDRDPLRRERVRLGRALQRLRQLQPVQRPRLARIRVDPDVERLTQQRLQLRHVQNDRLNCRALHDPRRPPYDP